MNLLRFSRFRKLSRLQWKLLMLLDFSTHKESPEKKKKIKKKKKNIPKVTMQDTSELHSRY